jgi:cobaltochelatase CobN
MKPLFAAHWSLPPDMHLLAAQPGGVSDGSEAVDLGQTPGDIVYLTAADTELASLSMAFGNLATDEPTFPSLRLANLMQLGHNMSVDLYSDQVICSAKIVIARVLGGRGYWSYGVDELAVICQSKNIQLVFLPGDDQPDAELSELSSVPADAHYRLWQYMVHGGPENAEHLLNYAASLIGFDREWQEPRALVRAGLHWPGKVLPALDEIKSNWTKGAPVVALAFYRALVQAGNVAAVDALIKSMLKAGLNPLPVFTQSLKDPVAAAILETQFLETPPDVIINATGFAVSAPGAARTATPFEAGRESNPPVILQAVFSGGNLDGWQNETRGLSPRDIAMNVALPEVDGRVFSRAVSFKGLSRRDELTQSDIVCYEPVTDRADFVAELAASWATLRRTEKSKRKVAIILANYPNQDGRLGNGVGLDTPAGTMIVLQALQKQGYTIEDMPVDGDALIDRLQSGPTNDFKDLSSRTVVETLSMADYQLFFTGLPDAVQKGVLERWGAAETDPFFMSGGVDCGHFAIAAYRLGNITIGLQPARGYNIDPVESYHDPALVPPHSYFAFYAWLRRDIGVQAVIHMGKHGNLEWLPGKALALSEACYPEATLGPLPNLYPFIVNDPGEGTQAKRRAAAVIIDHLTPPLTRAESYGPLRDLEQLVDEYYEASGVDPRRLKVLKKDILTLCQANGIDTDCGITGDDEEDEALGKLDNYLCELKEMQIRNGLHIFGSSPEGALLDDLLVALVRVPRGIGEGGDGSLHRALAKDLGMEFDPLDCDLAKNWEDQRPEILQSLTDEPWRSVGDTVERLELLAIELVAGRLAADTSWVQTGEVLKMLSKDMRPSVESCGQAEIDGLLMGLDGRFVEPGTSGAPTRGRPDVLPTGRNFYSVDTRTVPTPAAWTLGWKSATLLIERYMQDNGAWPKTMALSAWGTSNMRTGGDDIAQGLALMGVKPTWDSSSRRVTGFEVLPATVLGRPRVDVTLRISGFFRDAFPALIDLFDSAVRAVAEMDESDEQNPLRARIRGEVETLVDKGISEDDAKKRSGYRVFGSKPGAYGAGLQALIDEKGWQSDSDLAKAYVAWGGYAYGAGTEGKAEHSLFESRLKKVEAVIHNQDNREHDLLDSDDYYQFEGGMTAAVRELSGTQPKVYHNDHSRPETPRIRTLEDEIGRVVRARVVNPKWIEGVMRHGYKGAFEMAATVDYMFAFAATAHCVKDHHFDAVFDAYLNDDDVRAFLEEHNPAALKEMVNRLIEAEDRGLWKSRRNDTRPLLESLSG